MSCCYHTMYRYFQFIHTGLGISTSDSSCTILVYFRDCFVRNNHYEKYWQEIITFHILWQTAINTSLPKTQRFLTNLLIYVELSCYCSPWTRCWESWHLYQNKAYPFLVLIHFERFLKLLPFCSLKNRKSHR